MRQIQVRYSDSPSVDAFGRVRCGVIFKEMF